MHRIAPLFILIGLFLTLPSVTYGNNPVQGINKGADDSAMQGSDSQNDSVLIIYTGQGKKFEPGKINHLVFKISNASLTPKRLLVQMAFPIGLKSILPLTAFQLKPGESKIDRISFNLPISFPAGNYQLEIIFKETETEKVLYREIITMEVPEIENISFDLLEIPSFVMAGEQINVSYLLKNLGNSKQKIRIETYQCDKVSPAFIELEAGATSVVKVAATTSETYKSAGFHNFSVRAHVSDQMKKENFQSVSVFPVKEEKADPWFRFPVTLSTRYIARGREGEYQQGYQLEASGKGFLDTGKKHALEFMARGPNNFDLSFLGFYDEYYIGYKNKNLESFIGSKTYQLTPLLEMSRYGYGTENTFISGRGNKVGFYYVEPRFYKEIESETGAYALLNVFKENSIGLNYLQKKKSHGEGQAILGSVVATLHPFFATTVEMEYSAGGFPEKKDDAFRLRMASQHKVVSLSGNYFNTGKDFAGYYSNTSFYDANLHVNVSRALSVSLSAREDFTQASLDTLLNSAPYSKMYMSTLNLRVSSNFNVRMFYLDNLRKDRMQQKKFDYHSQTANLWLDRTTQKFSWQLGGEYGKTQNYLSFSDTENRQNSYRGSIRLGYSPTAHFRVNSFASYTNMNSFISPDQKNLLWGVSAYGQIHRNLTMNFQVQNSYNIEDYYQNRNLFQMSVDYNFLKRHKLNLASFYTLFQSQLDKPDYSIALTYSVNIGIPVKRTTEFGSLSGKISRQDGEPVKKIILMLNGNKSITADDGSFTIRNLVPGRYSLSVDRSKLEMDEIVDIPVPLQVEISGRQETTINLRLVKAARVTGIIRAAGSDASISALNHAPPQTGNIVLEMKDALETVRIITQPDGTFEFPSLRPSDWTLRIYKNNIDPSYNLEQEYTDLKLQPGELRDIIIELQPKTKRIIFKSTPLMVVSSTGNKEKSNLSDQDQKIRPGNLDDLWFTVQVASSNLVAVEGETTMKGVGEVTVRQIDGLYKYYSGRFSDYRAARAHARKMADIAPGAFLTAFEGDNPIPLKEAIDIWKHNRK